MNGRRLPATVASRFHIARVQLLGNARQCRDTTGPDLLDDREDIGGVAHRATAPKSVKATDICLLRQPKRP